MKRLIIGSILLIFCTMPSFAQRNTISAGMLIRNTEVIKKERQKKGFNASDFKRGYQQEVSFAYSFLDDLYGSDMQHLYLHHINFNYVGGYRFNHHIFIGVGTGLDFAGGMNFRPLVLPDIDGMANTAVTGQGDKFNHNIRYYGYLPVQKVSIPLYAHFKIYFMKTKWAPFFAFSGGIRISAPKQLDIYDYHKESGYYYNYIIDDCISTEKYGAVTGMFEVMPGVNYQYSNNLGFNFQFGYATRSGHLWGIPPGSSKYQLYYGGYDWYHGFTIRLGVTF